MKLLDKLNSAGLTVLAMRQDVTSLFRLQPTNAQRDIIHQIRGLLNELSHSYTARITKVMEANREALTKAARPSPRRINRP